MSPENFFVTEAVKHARNLSYRDAMNFMRGLLLVCGDVEEVAVLRRQFQLLQECDQQLELIAAGQLIFPLNLSGAAAAAPIPSAQTPAQSNHPHDHANQAH
jgi:hypothetical protein